MNNIEGYNALIGLLLPLIVGFITTKSLPGEMKSIISVVLIVAAALGSTWIAGKFNFQDIASALATIGVVHQASYELFNKYFAKALQGVGPIKDKPLVPTAAELGQ